MASQTERPQTATHPATEACDDNPALIKNSLEMLL